MVLCTEFLVKEVPVIGKSTVKRFWSFLLGALSVFFSLPAVLSLYAWLIPSGMAQLGAVFILMGVAQLVFWGFAFLFYRNGFPVVPPRFLLGNFALWIAGFFGYLAAHWLLAGTASLVWVTVYGVAMAAVAAFGVCTMLMPRRAHFVGG